MTMRGEPTDTAGSPARSNERPITEDFYRSPSGEWVYKWSDERLVLKEGRCVCCGGDASDGAARSDGRYCSECLSGRWDTHGI